MKNIKQLVIFVICGCTFYSPAFSQCPDSLQRNNVIAQMNYCINSLTNIINNKSMSVLDHESNMLLNNLTMEHIIGLNEINDFRIDLIDAVSTFGITEQERQLLRRVQSIQRDNMKWRALSNALNPTMLVTGSGPGMGYQIAFQALLTAARSVVEYQAMKGEQEIEELRAMWDLRKKDLEKIKELRIEGIKIIYTLYNKYQLKEEDRLTEETANNFNVYVSEIDPAKRVRILEENRSIYSSMMDYYYFLGMAYLDTGNYEKAKENFDIYIQKYSLAPLFRYDEKSGCIALAILSYDKNLTIETKKQYISMALKNLPHNSAASLQCAMIYLYELKDQEEALRLIRSGIDDPMASDKSLLFMAAANMLPIMKKYPSTYNTIVTLFNAEKDISLNSYLTFCINKGTDVWENIINTFSIDDLPSGWLQEIFLNDFLTISFPEKISYYPNDTYVYVEKHKEDKVEVIQLEPSFKNGVDISEFEDVDCFKENKDLKYLYFDVLVPEKTFILKRNLDKNMIKSGDWHGQQQFTLSTEDIKDIIEFCDDHSPKTWDIQLECTPIGGKIKNLGTCNNAEIFFKGSELKYSPYHSEKQSGNYIRIVLANGISVMYKYSLDTSNLTEMEQTILQHYLGERMKMGLIPYLYSTDDKYVYFMPRWKNEYEYVSQAKTESHDNKSWFSKAKDYVIDIVK